MYMNIYLQALIGLVAVFAVGFVFYGFLYKDALKDVAHDMSPVHLTLATVGLYVISYFFIQLFNHTTFTDVSAVLKGLYLGLMVGVAFFAIPLFTDQSFLKGKPMGVQAVLFNWVGSFVVLGIVAGFLNK
jgi:hypothetical protein